MKFMDAGVIWDAPAFKCQSSNSIAILSARIQKRSRSEGIAGHNNFPIQNLMGILDVRRSLSTLGITPTGLSIPAPNVPRPLNKYEKQ
jgi:hypothetical protein